MSAEVTPDCGTSLGDESSKPVSSRSPQSELLRYPVPWKLIAGLTEHIWRGTRTDVDAFTRAILGYIQPPPVFEGFEHLPGNPRFLLVANHYQREGLWILHSAGVLTQAIRQHYGAGDPPVRWVVTANWPPWKFGPIEVRSPGDILLPRVAHALHCYAIPFAGKDPKRTAKALRRILQDAKQVDRPIGLFPEGVAGFAGKLTDPLPGIDRFLRQLARLGLPAVPCGISEAGRFLIRFGAPITPSDILQAENPAALAMQRIAELIPS